MTIDNNEDLYLLGQYRDPSSQGVNIFVCQSQNNGNTWDLYSDFSVVVDSVQHDRISHILAFDGIVHIVGDASFNNNASYEWFDLISDDGLSWNRHTIYSENSYLPSLFDALTDPLGNLFVASFSIDDGTSNLGWRIVRSTNGGVDWQTSDVMSNVAIGSEAYSKAMTIDASGNIYAAGIAQEIANGPFYLVVRRSVDHGLSWDTIDDWSPETGVWLDADIWDILIDHSGNIVELGTIKAADGVNYWLERRIPVD